MRGESREEAISIALRRTIVGCALILAATVLGVLVALDPDPGRADAWWNANFGPALPGLVPAALLLDFLGGGWCAVLVPPVGALVLVLARRGWAALFFLVASVVSVAVIQVLKHLFARARPDQILVVSDFGSFPSGHTANVATIAAALAILFPRAWVALCGAIAVVAMAFARTLLHAHWLTDTIGGTLAGVGAALVVGAVFAAPLLREARAHPR